MHAPRDSRGHPTRVSRPTASSGPLERDGWEDATQCRAAIARATALLESAVGARWGELPSDLGRPAAAAEALLQQGPTAFDPATCPPGQAVGAGWRIATVAMTFADRLVDDAELLSEALRAPLLDMPLRQVQQVVGAVLDLGVVPGADPRWADRARAASARAVLAERGTELRSIRALHEELYTHFTEHVLDIPESLLRAGGKPWRVLARARLRGRLAAASRSGRPAGGLRVLSRQVLEVRAARARLAGMSPELTDALGPAGGSALIDVDALEQSLAAVRRVQVALDTRLDEARLAGLIEARAFAHPEIVTPAASLVTALRTWREEVVSSSGGDPWALPVGALATWARHAAAMLPALAAGVEALTEVGSSAETLARVVDDLLLRENVAELVDRLDELSREGRSSTAPEVMA